MRHAVIWAMVCSGLATPALWAQVGALGFSGEETFMPRPERLAGPVTLHMLPEARLSGGEVRLRQIARWSDADASLDALGELVVLHLEPGQRHVVFSLDLLRQKLRGAGVNMGRMRLAGPMQCTVYRSDVPDDEAARLARWARGGSDEPATRPARDGAIRPVALAGMDVDIRPAADGAVAAAADLPAELSLGELLIADLVNRTGLQRSRLQVDFDHSRHRLTGLSTRAFTFSFRSTRSRDIGAVAWEVDIVGPGQQRESVEIRATVQMWQTQVVAVRALNSGQIIQASDVQERDVLVDKVSADVPLSLAQVVDAQSQRDVRPGMVLTASMVRAVPLARPGQLVTVVLRQGGVKLTTVARAMDSGGYGQSIRVRHESTQQIYEVVLTGPQQATMGG